MKHIAPDHPLGRVDRVKLEDTPALSKDVPFDALQEEWPAFKKSFDSLRGRRMMGLVFNDQDVYRLCSVRLDRDTGNPLGLDETVIPGGDYLRMRMQGEAPIIYSQIPKAFEALFEDADHDDSRPHIEYYRREGEVDCLVPVHPLA